MSVGASWSDRRWFVTIVVMVVAADVGMAALDMGPQHLVVAAVGAVAGTAAWSVTSLAGSAAGQVRRRRAAQPLASAGADRHVKRLRGELLSTADPASAARLRARLVDVIDDQLEHAHGVSLTGEPDRARHLMGDDLAVFVSDPRAVGRLAGDSYLARVVTMIEQL